MEASQSGNRTGPLTALAHLPARQCGVSDTVIGFIFGMYPLVAFSSSLIYGAILIPKWGANFVLLSGIFLNGGAHLIFAFVTQLPKGAVFAVLSFLIRTASALGGSACENAVLAILIGEYRNNVPALMGVLEIFAGCAFMIGPVMGGGLYTIGGFKAPFLIMGGVLLLFIPAIWSFLPSKIELEIPERKQQMNISKVLRIPGVILISFQLAIGYTFLSFLDPTLAPYVKQIGLDATQTGLLFLVIFLSYAIVTPLTGWVCEKTHSYRSVMMFGFLLSGVGLLLLGPAPFLSSFLPQRKIWLMCVALAACGIAETCYYVPTIPEMQACCHERGLPKDLSTDSLLSGLFTGASNLGGFAGPVLGGIMMDHIGFQWMSSAMAFLSFSQAVVLFVFTLFHRRRPLEEEQPLLLGSDNRHSRLNRNNRRVFTWSSV